MFDSFFHLLDQLTLPRLLLLMAVVAMPVLGYGWFRFTIYLLSSPLLYRLRFPRFQLLYNPVAAAYFRAGRFHQRITDWVRRRRWSDSEWSVAVRLLLRLDRLEGWAVRWWEWVSWQDVHLLLLLLGGVYNLLFLPLLLLTYVDTVSQLNGFIDQAPSRQMVEYNPFIRRYIHRFSGLTPFYGWEDPLLYHRPRSHTTSYYYSEKTPFRYLKKGYAIFRYRYQASTVHRESKLASLFMIGYLGVLPLQLFVLHRAAYFYTYGIYSVEINTRWLQQIIDGQNRLMFHVVRMNRVMGLWLLFHLPLVANLLWGPINFHAPIVY
jgi:hypothetical protein